MLRTILLAVLVLPLTGCTPGCPPVRPDTAANVTAAGGAAKAQAAAVGQSQARILSATDSAKAAVQAASTEVRTVQDMPVPPLIAELLTSAQTHLCEEAIPALGQIELDAEALADIQKALTTTVVQPLQQSAKEIGDLEKQNVSLAQQLAAEKDRNRRLVLNILLGMGILGVLVLAGGVYLAVRGNVTTGAAIATGGLVLAVVAFMLHRWLDYLEWGALVLGIVGLVTLGVYIWHRYKMGRLAAAKNTALAQIVPAYDEFKAWVASLVGTSAVAPSAVLEKLKAIFQAKQQDPVTAAVIEATKKENGNAPRVQPET